MAFLQEESSSRDYRILGLESDAPPEKVKQVYRELAKRWHPDRFQQQTSLERHRAEEKFKEITAAYRRISKTWKDRQAPGTGGPKTGEAPKSSETPREGPVRRAKPSARRPAPQTPTGGPLRSLSARFKGLRFPRDRRTAVTLVSLLLVALTVTYLIVPEWFGPEPPPPQQNNRFSRTEGSERIVTSSTGDPSTSKETPPEPAPTAPPELLPPVGPSADGSYYGIGSTQADVLRIQGPPTRTQGQTWVYGLADIQFKDGRLFRYNNFDGSLKVRLIPRETSKGENPAFFTLGSSQNDVLLVQGTPTQIGANRWHYGFSEIRFKEGRVEEYNNYFGNLKVRLIPSEPPGPTPQKGYFTVGSSRDAVLALQGTPTVIQGNTWYYQSSYVTFREGKVQFALSLDGNLFYLPPDETAGREEPQG